MAKDAAFAKMYRPSSMKVARPAPPSMFACFFVRDLVCMAAFFTLPPQLSAELQAPRFLRCHRCLTHRERERTSTPVGGRRHQGGGGHRVAICSPRASPAAR